MEKGQDRSLAITMVSYIFAPLWAGPAERFLRYTPGLKKRGIDLGFLTVRREDTKEKEVYREAEVKRIGPVDLSVAKNTGFTKKAILLVAKTKPRIALFLVLTPAHIPYLLWLRIKGIKTVLINTMARERNSSKRGPKEILSDIAHLFLLRSVDHHVFSTDVIAAHSKEVGYKREDSISIIPNGVDLNRFAPAENVNEVKALREELDLPLNDKLFLFVGLRIPRKGVLELLKGWKVFKDRGGKGSLVLVGRNQDEKKELEAFNREWDELVSELRDYQIIVKPSSNEVEKFFKACDVFTFLSKHEGMPNVILEAMACGLPVVTTRFKGFSDAFGRDGKELIITSHEQNHIADDLQKISTPEVYQNIQKDGLQWIKDHQDLENVLNQYTNLFNLLVKR